MVEITSICLIMFLCHTMRMRCALTQYFSKTMRLLIGVLKSNATWRKNAYYSRVACQVTRHKSYRKCVAYDETRAKKLSYFKFGWITSKNCANLQQSVSVVHPKVNQINVRQDPVEMLHYEVLIYNLSYFTVASISAYFQIYLENYIESFSWHYIIF